MWKHKLNDEVENATTAFQKDLIVWKRLERADTGYFDIKFQKDLIVWKQIRWWNNVFSPRAFQKDLIVWKPTLNHSSQ